MTFCAIVTSSYLNAIFLYDVAKHQEGDIKE